MLGQQCPYFDIEGVSLRIKDLGDEEKAGSIPGQMEAEIRKSKALIADVSLCNTNVFWEAGFAHGLSKAVIYFYDKNLGFTLPFDIRHIRHIEYHNEIPPANVAKTLANFLLNAGLLTQEEHTLVMRSIERST